eukprot:1209133-Rhodomonas_salina.2
MKKYRVRKKKSSRATIDGRPTNFLALEVKELTIYETYPKCSLTKSLVKVLRCECNSSRTDVQEVLRARSQPDRIRRMMGHGFGKWNTSSREQYRHWLFQSGPWSRSRSTGSQ